MKKLKIVELSEFIAIFRSNGLPKYEQQTIRSITRIT